MGYFSDLHIRMVESGVKPERLTLPRCPICGSEQIELDISAGGTMVQVFCSDRTCPGFDNPHWITIPRSNKRR